MASQRLSDSLNLARHSPKRSQGILAIIMHFLRDSQYIFGPLFVVVVMDFCALRRDPFHSNFKRLLVLPRYLPSSMHNACTACILPSPQLAHVQLKMEVPLLETPLPPISPAM